MTSLNKRKRSKKLKKWKEYEFFYFRAGAANRFLDSLETARKLARKRGSSKRKHTRKEPSTFPCLSVKLLSRTDLPQLQQINRLNPLLELFSAYQKRQHPEKRWSLVLLNSDLAPFTPINHLVQEKVVQPYQLWASRFDSIYLRHGK